ncbi:MAG: hypothetical protein ACYCZR_11890 [Burkholderiales bacterium]
MYSKTEMPGKSRPKENLAKRLSRAAAYPEGDRPEDGSERDAEGWRSQSRRDERQANLKNPVPSEAGLALVSKGCAEELLNSTLKNSWKIFWTCPKKKGEGWPPSPTYGNLVA